MFCKIVEVDGQQVLARLEPSSADGDLDAIITAERDDCFVSFKLGPYPEDVGRDRVAKFNELAAREALKQFDEFYVPVVKDGE